MSVAWAPFFDLLIVSPTERDTVLILMYASSLISLENNEKGKHVLRWWAENLPTRSILFADDEQFFPWRLSSTASITSYVRFRNILFPFVFRLTWFCFLWSHGISNPVIKPLASLLYLLYCQKFNRALLQVFFRLNRTFSKCFSFLLFRLVSLSFPFFLPYPIGHKL